MKIYISSSWKNRARVRALAVSLRANGHLVYDFTDPACRALPEIPPEKFPEHFDPAKGSYRDYILSFPEWRGAVECNRAAIEHCDAVVLLLPSGLDAHADAFFGLGLGKRLVVVGDMRAGDRVPTHLWAERLLERDDEVVGFLAFRAHARNEAASPRLARFF